MSNSDQSTTGWLPERYSLSNQTAVVTGGAKGIGAAIVRELMALGCRVVVW
uniref:SDR family NAD(P)-dependent oxidoreductase n=1 Tax=Klebsiella pneumoniae TaxID=573 RepID=UPI0013CFE680